LDPSVLGSNISLSASASPGAAPALSTGVTAANRDFLDTLATGLIALTVTNDTVQGDWLQLQITKTNGTQISVAVTNNTPDTNISHLCQSLLEAVNATPGLQGMDGVLGGELYPDTHQAQFLVYARSPGWQAAQIQATLTTSPDLLVLPAGTRGLQDNLSDLRPRNHLYVSSGLTDFALPFTLDTTQLSDGFHELTLIAYEGTSVRTQTRVTRTVQIQNSSLLVTLTPQLTGTNITLDTPLSIAVSANTNAIALIQLFSTGGPVGVVSNQAAGTFQVPASFLGVGLHPFYAVVTDNLGHQYRTRTTSIRILPSLVLTIGGQPLTLSWDSSPGVAYDILVSSNLASGFQKTAGVTATSTTALWPVPQSTNQAFYRVRTQGN